MEGFTDLNGKNSQRACEEILIPVPWGHIAAKWWGSRKKQPIIALHGWQDNAGTFDRLCPLLTDEIPILCIDLPGHGKSSHLPKGMQYYLYWDAVAVIRRIVKHYGWTNVTLMGHSLGGTQCFIYAASYPTEVEKFISLDVAGPTLRDHTKTVSETGTYLDKFYLHEKLEENQLPSYSYNELIDLLVFASANSLTRDSAKILLQRGTKPAINKSGYILTRDGRLVCTVFALFSYDMLMSYANAIKCDCLNVRAETTIYSDKDIQYYNEVIDVQRKTAKRLTYKIIPGTHYLHLNSPEKIADIINKFLLS